MAKKKKIHFTGIGSPVVFDLAIALQQKGYEITGSNDGTLDDLAQERLTEYQLAPEAGWRPHLITSSLDAVILSPQISRDNPELHRALELKVPVFSYPEFIHEECTNKHRIVITGSSGKTMIALLIMHVLHYHNRSFDYVLSKPIPGVKDSIRLTEAPVVIIEGQDGLSSCMDPTTIFLNYHHHIGVISGIEWTGSPDYASKDEYKQQFTHFESSTPKGGVLIYFDLEPVLAALSKEHQPDVLYIPYKTHPSQVEGGQEFLVESSAERHPVKLSGKHNMQNISAAKETLKKLGVTSPMFYEALRQFGGNNL
jgi:UDP-N-acetylmuramate: L-alanyl-gamma-D-glutamyl-meso-diaminopimelate ligase